MKVLKHGKFHCKAVVTCPECECEFETWYRECDQSKYLDFRWATCPECGESILLQKKDFLPELSEKEK